MRTHVFWFLLYVRPHGRHNAGEKANNVCLIMFLTCISFGKSAGDGERRRSGLIAGEVLDRPVDVRPQQVAAAG